jgi:hypothetical protein
VAVLVKVAEAMQEPLAEAVAEQVGQAKPQSMRLKVQVASRSTVLLKAML